MAKHNKIGEIGEDLAEKYLKKKGYFILKRNYRTKYFEIDIICTFYAPACLGFISGGHKSLVFVEVRTKTNEDFGRPEESINKDKKKKLLKAAKLYVAFNDFEGNYRVDVICVVLNKEGNKLKRISHYENIDLI
ncbi:MAG: YraN family protein [Candidatus Paceibacterota bacterium]